MKWIVCALVGALGLSACGGGDGGTPASNTTNAPTPNPGDVASTPVASTGIPPQTSVPAPTYAANSAQQLIFERLNAYRQQLGVGQRKQDPALDTAAQAHAQYLMTNNLSGAVIGLTHDEVPTLPGFYGATLADRTKKAGLSSLLGAGEVISGESGATVGTASKDASVCVNGLLNTVYHMMLLTDSSEAMGIGYTSFTFGGLPSTNCVIDTSLGAGQQFAANKIVHVPDSDEGNVPLAMDPETPDPASDIKSPGRPIMVRVNAENKAQLTVDHFQLTDNVGAIVPARILVPPSVVSGSKARVTPDPNNLLSPGVAFLLPLSPLKANTKYTVQFAGARDAKPMSTTWSFTTGAAPAGSAGTQ